MTTMQEQLEACKRRSFELAKSHPGTLHSKILDLSAQSIGYPHYTGLRKLLRLLGPEGTPSRVAILEAGGSAADCPLRPVAVEATAFWTNQPATPHSSAATPAAMTEADVRAVIARIPDLTLYGLGIPVEERTGNGVRKAMAAGQASLVARFEECSRALRYAVHLRPRQTINPRAGSSYGLKHAAEEFLRRQVQPPDDCYVANGAFICAMVHLGFELRPCGPGIPNANFNISARSPVLEWRALEHRWDRRSHTAAGQARLAELRKLLGIA